MLLEKDPSPPNVNPHGCGRGSGLDVRRYRGQQRYDGDAESRHVDQHHCVQPQAGHQRNRNWRGRDLTQRVGSLTQTGSSSILFLRYQHRCERGISWPPDRAQGRRHRSQAVYVPHLQPSCDHENGNEQ